MQGMLDSNWLADGTNFNILHGGQGADLLTNLAGFDNNYGPIDPNRFRGCTD